MSVARAVNCAGTVTTAAGLVVPESALPAAPAAGGLTVGGLKGDTRVWGRAPDPAWIADLRAISARSTAHSWLYLDWEAGDPWEPIERWMLFQVIPADRVRPEVAAELRGPDPRATGHYCGPSSRCGCTHRPDRWVGGRARLTTVQQWRRYRALDRMGHPGWALPFWVIQGDAGGHPAAYTDTEAALAELVDLPNEPPVPGELDYAEPDARTWAAVQAYDRVARGQKLLERTTDDLAAEDRADALAVRRGMLDMLTRTTRQALGAWGEPMRRELSDVRLGAFSHTVERVDYDAEAEDFLADVD